MLDQLKQMMEAKRQVDQIKRELDATSIEVNDVPGIKISVSGSQKFQSIRIDDDSFNIESKERLEADLLCSINTAIAKSQNLATQKMKEVTGLNIPGR